MKKFLLSAVILLAGCSVLEKKELFVVCRAADVTTTLIGQQKGFVELNPLMKPLLSTPALYIAVQFAVTYYVVKRWEALEKQEYKVALNILNCIPAVHNLGQF